MQCCIWFWQSKRGAGVYQQRLVIEYETRRRAKFVKEAHKFNKVHAEKAIKISKHCVSGKCCVVSMNFDEIFSE